MKFDVKTRDLALREADNRVILRALHLSVQCGSRRKCLGGFGVIINIYQ